MRWTLADLQELARTKGGDCLSTDYLGLGAKHLWRCEKNHQWETAPSHLKRGSWCPYCARKLIWAPGMTQAEARLQECKEIAQKRGGDCLSASYSGDNQRLLWRCANNHTWEAVPTSIKQGRWCDYCHGRKIWSPGVTQSAARIATFRSLAQSKGGECLSTVYLGMNADYLWCCADGHEWEASASNMSKDDRWCPVCSEGLMESACRTAFELLTNETWPKIRPKWLVNDRAGRMEIDGYCRSIKCGFEYQGRQHSQLVSVFHLSESDLNQRIIDDQRKRDLCAEHGIKLIEVRHTVALSDLLNFVSKALEEALGRSFKIPEGLSVMSLGHDRGRLSELRILAGARGGYSRANSYLGFMVAHPWECSDGHHWEASPSTIRGGSWCPFCAGKRIWSPGQTESEARLEECRALAQAQGGECLSSKYLRNSAKLRWRCSQNHSWDAPMATIKSNGSWCPFCAGLRIWSPGKSESEARLEECQELARSKGGECLSPVYLGVKKQHLWACAGGHTWVSSPDAIKNNGAWCPFCAGQRIWSPGQTESEARLEECRALAEAKGGECLSPAYLGGQTKLRWRCANDHEWDVKPTHVKAGVWCPTCAKKARGDKTRRRRQAMRTTGAYPAVIELQDEPKK
jgi:hypothetical protein